MVKGESFRMFEGYFGQGLVRREHSRARAVAAAVAAFFRGQDMSRAALRRPQSAGCAAACECELNSITFLSIFKTLV